MPVVIDTNVLVRLATGDHAHQHARAQALFAAEQVRVLLTVVLETEWVLRSRYGYAPEQFASFVHWLLASPGVAVEDADAVEQALAWHGQRMDFADALHLARGGGDRFLSFDRALARQAAALELIVHEP